MRESNRIQMKQLTPKVQVILTGIKSIYLNPYHYTYVIQKQDNYIYLYDEMTMQIVGSTKVPLNQPFKTFMFTDNFNVFCAYIEKKVNSCSQSQIIVFTLNSDGVIGHYRYPLIRNQEPANLTLNSIDYYQSHEKENYIIGISVNKVHYINFKGQIIKEIDITYKGRQLNLINAFVIKSKQWIFLEENKIYFVNVNDGYKIEDELEINGKINSIFRSSLRGKFMAFITDLHTVTILTQKSDRWSATYKFKIPNLIIKKLSFFYPGVNTSTINRFKDRLYILVHGDPYNYYEERNKDITKFPEYFASQEKIHNYPIPNQLLKDHSLYVYEFSIDDLRSQMQDEKPLLKNAFCLKNIGIIKYTIWANEHSENCVRIFNNEKTILSVDLIPLLQQSFAGREWVCLGYRFQARSSNILYEQTEDNFENEQKKVGRVEHSEVNDWCYSLFSKESVVSRRIKRLNCLQF